MLDLTLSLILLELHSLMRSHNGLLKLLSEPSAAWMITSQSRRHRTSGFNNLRINVRQPLF